eukprot:TRINITY_DN16840_c0_g4_i1.p1 TRINITY_DN16840_c0_g4~~TRINITY_DN16840_c0_g4_i1.p1  ORF type:complete len:1085 (-),score=164.11 TRINITY_DN16840_c0_g4_i1:112-3366(-)
MAVLQTKSYCILHPGSELDSARFSASDIHLELDAGFDGAGSASGSSPGGGAGRRESFLFDRVFPPKTSQDRVFQDVARDPVMASLDSFVSVAFVAMGATGGGKTFAITGGAKRFADRGLIPRSISTLFEALGARLDRDDFEVSVSFYEIYKDAVVDLLSERRRRVTVENDGQGPVLVGLQKQKAATESDAYHLLFQGDSNRHFERLPANPETSRGHVFYVLHVAHVPSGRETNLSFIDLAAPISTRNHATASIVRSLDALRATVSAIRGNRKPPFEASVLTQLLQPWLQPCPGSKVQLVLVSPVKYMDEQAKEQHEWLLFARLAREALLDQAKLMEEHGAEAQDVEDYSAVAEKNAYANGTSQAHYQDSGPIHTGTAVMAAATASTVPTATVMSPAGAKAAAADAAEAPPEGGPTYAALAAAYGSVTAQSAATVAPPRSPERRVPAEPQPRPQQQLLPEEQSPQLASTSFAQSEDMIGAPCSEATLPPGQYTPLNGSMAGLPGRDAEISAVSVTASPCGWSPRSAVKALRRGQENLDADAYGGPGEEQDGGDNNEAAPQQQLNSSERAARTWHGTSDSYVPAPLTVAGYTPGTQQARPVPAPILSSSATSISTDSNAVSRAGVGTVASRQHKTSTPSIVPHLPLASVMQEEPGGCKGDAAAKIQPQNLAAGRLAGTSSPSPPPAMVMQYGGHHLTKTALGQPAYMSSTDLLAKAPTALPLGNSNGNRVTSPQASRERQPLSRQGSPMPMGQLGAVSRLPAASAPAPSAGGGGSAARSPSPAVPAPAHLLAQRPHGIGVRGAGAVPSRTTDGSHPFSRGASPQRSPVRSPTRTSSPSPFTPQREAPQARANVYMSGAYPGVPGAVSSAWGSYTHAAPGPLVTGTAVRCGSPGPHGRELSPTPTLRHPRASSPCAAASTATVVATSVSQPRHASPLPPRAPSPMPGRPAMGYSPVVSGRPTSPVPAGGGSGYSGVFTPSRSGSFNPGAPAGAVAPAALLGSSVAPGPTSWQFAGGLQASPYALTPTQHTRTSLGRSPSGGHCRGVEDVRIAATAAVRQGSPSPTPQRPPSWRHGAQVARVPPVLYG